MQIIRLAITVVFIALLGTGQALSQETRKTQEVTKGVFWSDSVSGVEVYLIPTGAQSYRLSVISTKDVAVTYHTSINSMEAVTKELKPAIAGGVRYYEFQHYFSKMTIWMSLEFTVDGKKTPALTRAFYDNIFQLAPGNMYLGPEAKVMLFSGLRQRRH
jgi:hypothetical protein